MFKRVVETHQKGAFEGLEAAKEYAESAQKSPVKGYAAFLNNLKSLDIQGEYLDVGAGTGNLAAIIAQNNPGIEITALEISKDMITVGEDFIKSKGLQDQVKFKMGDAADKETMNELGKFDLVYSTYSLHHWEHPEEMIGNLRASLAHNGLFYIFDLRRVWWLYWIPKENGFFNSIRAAYVRSEIQDMLKDFPPESLEIKSEAPFMQSIFIRMP